MKAISKICAVGLAVFAGVGLCADQAMAQTNALAVHAESSEQRQSGPTRLFEFGGGTPLNFVADVIKQCKADWDVATIPPGMERALVPSIRLRVNTNTPQELLELYNRLAEQDPNMGKWIWEGPASAPTYLMLVAPPPSPAAASNAAVALKEPEMDVKIFLMTYISGTNLATVAEAVKAIAEIDQRNARANGLIPAPSHVVVDERTGEIILTGSREFLTLAEKTLQHMDIPSVPTDRPVNPNRQFGGGGQN